MSAEHGARYRYDCGCRCDACRAAKAAYDQARRAIGRVGTHGYGGYSNGCRCDTCRKAKAAYSRAIRAKAKAERPDGRIPVVGIKHGHNGYQNHYCRCYTCSLAHAQQDGRSWAPGRTLAREYLGRES